MHDSDAIQKKGAPRGRRRTGETTGREVLLAAAITEFSKNGYDGTSLRTVAAAAGVDMALVARLFGSKAELWRAMVNLLASLQVRHRECLAEIDELSLTDPGLGVVRLIELVADISVEIPAFPTLLMLEAANPGDRLHVLLETLVDPFRSACMPIIKSAGRAGVIRIIDPNIFFSMLLTAISLPMVSPTVFLRKGGVAARLKTSITAQACAVFLTTSAYDELSATGKLPVTTKVPTKGSQS